MTDAAEPISAPALCGRIQDAVGAEGLRMATTSADHAVGAVEIVDPADLADEDRERAVAMLAKTRAFVEAHDEEIRRDVRTAYDAYRADRTADTARPGNPLGSPAPGTECDHCDEGSAMAWGLYGEPLCRSCADAQAARRDALERVRSETAAAYRGASDSELLDAALSNARHAGNDFSTTPYGEEDGVVACVLEEEILRRMAEGRADDPRAAKGEGTR